MPPHPLTSGPSPWHYPLLTIKILATLHLTTTYILTIKGTSGPSMLPTLNTRGDFVLISNLHRRGRWIRAGDIISFKHPLVPGEAAVKRVLGLPGDWIVSEANDGSDAVEAQGKGRLIQVPQGHVWVEGDHSPWSRDSRVYGPVPLALVKGRVLAKGKVFGGWRWFGNPFDGEG